MTSSTSLGNTAIAAAQGRAAQFRHVAGRRKFDEAVAGLLYTPDLAERWVVREPAALKEVETTLSRADLTMEAVAAETLVAKLDMFERIERMIATAEFRRNAILHQKDRRRLMLEESFLRSLEEFERGQS